MRMLLARCGLLATLALVACRTPGATVPAVPAAPVKKGPPPALDAVVSRVGTAPTSGVPLQRWVDLAVYGPRDEALAWCERLQAQAVHREGKVGSVLWPCSPWSPEALPVAPSDVLLVAAEKLEPSDWLELAGKLPEKCQATRVSVQRIESITACEAVRSSVEDDLWAESQRTAERVQDFLRRELADYAHKEQAAYEEEQERAGSCPVESPPKLKQRLQRACKGRSTSPQCTAAKEVVMNSEYCRIASADAQNKRSRLRAMRTLLQGRLDQGEPVPPPGPVRCVRAAEWFPEQALAQSKAPDKPIGGPSLDGGKAPTSPQ